MTYFFSRFSVFPVITDVSGLTLKVIHIVKGNYNNKYVFPHSFCNYEMKK